MYGGVVADIRAGLAGLAAKPLGADGPRVQVGARSVRVIERTLACAKGEAK